jgi:protein SCO1/2
LRTLMTAKGTFMRHSFVAGLLLALALAAQAAPANPTALPRDSIYQLAAPLVDQGGRHLMLADMRGRVQVAVMFYTSCTVACPTIIDTLLDLERKLAPDERPRVGVLMVTLDPQRDSPPALKAMADKRGLDPSRWTLAQPQPADVRAIASVLGVRYRQLADGDFNHTSVLVLLDRDGRIVARSAKASGQVDPQFVARVQGALTHP